MPRGATSVHLLIGFMDSPSLKLGLKLVLAILFATCPLSISMADELNWLSGSPESAPTTTFDASHQQLPIRKVGGALAVVLGAFILLTQLMRKRNPAATVNALMEPLGCVQIAPKIRLHLVRLGTRILVLHISGQNVQRVTELVDPNEVEPLLATRRQLQPNALPISIHEFVESGQLERGNIR